MTRTILTVALALTVLASAAVAGPKVHAPAHHHQVPHPAPVVKHPAPAAKPAAVKHPTPAEKTAVAKKPAPAKPAPVTKVVTKPVVVNKVTVTKPVTVNKVSVAVSNPVKVVLPVSTSLKPLPGLPTLGGGKVRIWVGAWGTVRVVVPVPNYVPTFGGFSGKWLSIWM
jgi:hypothetical protein